MIRNINKISEFFLRLLFKKVSLFRYKGLGFEMTFPESVWLQKRIRNNFIFLKKNTTSAIVMTVYNDKEYTDAILKQEFKSFLEFKAGDYSLLVTSKLFEKYNEQQYEWAFIDNGRKVMLFYSMPNSLNAQERENSYNEVSVILCSLKKKVF
jgi:hypothetical protein